MADARDSKSRGETHESSTLSSPTKSKMNHQLIIFDLDSTLTESKCALDEEMANLLCLLIKQKKVLIISGGAFAQFQKQVVNYLPCNQSFNNLYLAPLNGGNFYAFKNGQWETLYEESLSQTEKEKIMGAFDKSFKETGFSPPQKVYGTLIEDRGGQITFSALGSKAPLELKKQWDPDHQKRMKIKQSLEKYLPDFAISIGGMTSIDIHRKGIDKAYGVKKISAHLSISLDKILFVGDALFKGGNDYPVLQLGIETKSVSGPAETKELIKEIIKI